MISGNHTAIEPPYRLHEIDLQQMHGQVDRPTATSAGPSIEPLLSGHKQFDEPPLDGDDPSLRPGVLHRHEIAIVRDVQLQD
jgi:hypothetical protein